jgi:hypothetical protein
MQCIERRNTPRGALKGEPPRAQLRSTILDAYADMPGLKLTLPQAARLFGVPTGTCRSVLEALVADGALRRSPEQRYESNRML